MAAVALAGLAPPVAAWFRGAYGEPTPAQALAIPAVLASENLLLSSPTGSGKTLAAFLGVISKLHELHALGGLRDQVYCVYVSPLRALVHDMARNLDEPLAGIRRLLGDDAARIRVGLRTGDTPRAERERMTREPPHILVTTPESLALVLSSPRMRRHLANLRYVIVDEVHALAESKRGTQLVLALERLERLASRGGAPPPARIGLSATVAPVERVAAFLTGGRTCRIEEVAPAAPPEFEVTMPVADPVRASEEEVEQATLDRLGGILARNATTLVFTNTRRQAERLSERLRERYRDAYEADDPSQDSHDPAFPRPEQVPFVAPHHGSMSVESRLVVEERLKREEMRCVVTSSSLEMGVHLGSVDHVVLVGNPKSSARTLQRIGRAGHRYGAISRATLLVDDPAELPAALALRELVRRREIEAVKIPEGSLDVLAQHVVALALDEDALTLDEAFALTRRCWCYHSLPRDHFDAVVHHLIDQRLVRLHDGRIRPVGGRSSQVLLTHAGTIPEAALLRVFNGPTWVGEIEEAYAESLQPGDVFLLGGRAWRYLRAAPTRCLVQPAPAQPPSVPAWRGEGIGMSNLLADALAHARHPGSRGAPFGGHGCNGEDETLSASDGHVRFQAAFSHVPAANEVAVESFPDDDGRRALAFHLVAGRGTNEALARAAAHRLARQLDAPVRVTAADEGFVLHAPRAFRPTVRRLAGLFEQPLEASLREALRGSDLLKRRFRHVAARGLLLLRRQGETLTQRQQRANQLLASLHDDHPLVQEAWREVLHDALDLEAAERIRRDIASGARPLTLMPQRPCPSPMGARLVVRGHGAEHREALRDYEERARDWIDIDRMTRARSAAAPK